MINGLIFAGTGRDEYCFYNYETKQANTKLETQLSKLRNMS